VNCKESLGLLHPFFTVISLLPAFPWNNANGLLDNEWVRDELLIVVQLVRYFQKSNNKRSIKDYHREPSCLLQN